MGYGTGSVESYYYLAFSAMYSLDAVFYVNEVHYQNLLYEMVCGQPLQFRAEIAGDVSTNTGFLKWYIDNVEETAVQDQLTWNKALAPGTYKIKMEVLMSDNTTIRTLEGTLTIIEAEITNTSGKSTICVGNTVYLAGTPSGGRWESVNYTTATVDFHGTVTGLSAGSAEIRYIIEEQYCTDTASVVIKVTNTTVDASTTPEICRRENGTITLNVHSDEPSTVKYVWKKLTETTPILTNLQAGTYSVTVSDTFCVVNKTIEVEHVDAPVANFDFPDNVIYNNVFFITDLSKGTVQIWDWDMGDGNKLTGKNISHIYPEPGDYKISLAVSDINECTDSISKIIHIHNELIIFIPNIFTPNGDGINDTWKPEMLDYSKKGYQLSIFDRWGQRIFHTTDTEEAWDGTINNKIAASNAVFSYQIMVKDVMGKGYKFTGHITLVR
jgi:gliding motility-associated-like protein